MQSLLQAVATAKEKVHVEESVVSVLKTVYNGYLVPASSDDDLKDWPTWQGRGS